MPSVQEFVDALIWWCNEGDLGYSQGPDRWDLRVGGSADCSSLVIGVLRKCGFPTGNASYTGDMRGELAANGWNVMSGVVALDPDNLYPGDILLKEGEHVATYVGNGMVAECWINEFGDIIGGEPGDQTGNESRVTGIWNSTSGWTHVLRYVGPQDSSSASETTPEEKTPAPEPEEETGMKIVATTAPWGDYVYAKLFENGGGAISIDPDRAKWLNFVYKIHWIEWDVWNFMIEDAWVNHGIVRGQDKAVAAEAAKNAAADIIAKLKPAA